MDAIYEVVQKILWATSFIAIGGTVALMFMLVFAQSIFGLKTIQQQLEQLRGRTEETNRRLDRMIDLLKPQKQAD